MSDLVKPTPDGWNNLAEKFLNHRQANIKPAPLPHLPELLNEPAQNLKEKGFLATLIELILAIFDYSTSSKR